MLVNILIYVIAGAFSVYVFYSACRKYIGLNPQAPSLWERIKAWWPGFVKRHIVDDDPYQDESHAGTRYQNDYIDWSNPALDGFDLVAADSEIDSSLRRVWAYKYSKNDPMIIRCGHWMHESDAGDIELVPDCAIIGPIPPWRESLCHRTGR